MIHFINFLSKYFGNNSIVNAKFILSYIKKYGLLFLEGQGR